MRATIAADYDTADIERIHYASDGGGWCVNSGLGGVGGSIEQGLDLYHVMRYVHRAFPEGAGREHLVSLALKCRPEAFVKAIEEVPMNYEDLTPEQQEKAKACKSIDELIELAKTEGVELSDEQVEAISGGQ